MQIFQEFGPLTGKQDYQKNEQKFNEFFTPYFDRITEVLNDSNSINDIKTKFKSSKNSPIGTKMYELIEKEIDFITDTLKDAQNHYDNEKAIKAIKDRLSNPKVIENFIWAIKTNTQVFAENFQAKDGRIKMNNDIYYTTSEYQLLNCLHGIITAPMKNAGIWNIDRTVTPVTFDEGTPCTFIGLYGAVSKESSLLELTSPKVNGIQQYFTETGYKQWFKDYIESQLSLDKKIYNIVILPGIGLGQFADDNNRNQLSKWYNQCIQKLAQDNQGVAFVFTDALSQNDEVIKIQQDKKLKNFFTMKTGVETFPEIYQEVSEKMNFDKKNIKPLYCYAGDPFTGFGNDCFIKKVAYQTDDYIGEKTKSNTNDAGTRSGVVPAGEGILTISAFFLGTINPQYPYVVQKFDEQNKCVTYTSQHTDTDLEPLKVNVTQKNIDTYNELLTKIKESTNFEDDATAKTKLDLFLQIIGREPLVTKKIVKHIYCNGFPAVQYNTAKDAFQFLVQKDTFFGFGKSLYNDLMSIVNKNQEFNKLITDLYARYYLRLNQSYNLTDLHNQSYAKGDERIVKNEHLSVFRNKIDIPDGTDENTKKVYEAHNKKSEQLEVDQFIRKMMNADLDQILKMVKDNIKILTNTALFDGFKKKPKDFVNQIIRQRIQHMQIQSFYNPQIKLANNELITNKMQAIFTAETIEELRKNKYRIELSIQTQNINKAESLQAKLNIIKNNQDILSKLDNENKTSINNAVQSAIDSFTQQIDSISNDELINLQTSINTLVKNSVFNKDTLVKNSVFNKDTIKKLNNLNKKLNIKIEAKAQDTSVDQIKLESPQDTSVDPSTITQIKQEPQDKSVDQIELEPQDKNLSTTTAIEQLTENKSVNQIEPEPQDKNLSTTTAIEKLEPPQNIDEIEPQQKEKNTAGQFPVTKGGQKITFWATVVSWVVNLFKYFSKEKEKEQQKDDNCHTHTL